MYRSVFVFLAICGLFFPAGLSLAVRQSGPASTRDLTERLEGFENTFSDLEAANREFLDYNRKLKAHIEQGQNALASLKKQYETLTQEAKLYASKTEKKSGELSAFEAKQDEIKSRMQTLEQDIAMKQLVIDDRRRRQEVIWEQMAAVNNNEPVAQIEERNTTALAEILNEKGELAEQWRDAQSRLADLEAQIAYEAILREDLAVSLPRLSGERDALEQRLTALAGGSAAQPAVDPKQLKKLNLEIKELAKRRLDQVNLLQMLETQYDKNQKMTKNSPQEKKLQEGIAALKRDNKLLRQQVVDLRFEMVDMDKRKSHLERVVKSAR
jgi:chromosome segregation ATPase